MKIAVWKTGHEIADKVAEAVYEGLKQHCEVSSHTCGTDRNILGYECHIGYGILRGTTELFKDCERLGVPWFNIDRGYWKPGHYDGYYRISLLGTQQAFGLDKLEPDYDRWDALGIEIDNADPKGRYAWLHCPPTKPVEKFYDIKLNELPKDSRLRIRDKSTLRKLQTDLDSSCMVSTFNSSVGWEALRQGIPVVSDPTHSIVGAYQKMLDKPIHADSNERRKLFAIMAGLQLRLDEIKSGALWPLLHKLLNL